MTAALSWCKNVSHSTVESWNVSGLTWGRLRVIQTVSISIPRKIILVAGPSVFAGATGTHTGPVPYTMQQHTEEHREPRTARNHPDSGCPGHHHGSPESTASYLPLHYRAWVQTGDRMAVLYLHRCGPSTASPASGG